MKESPEAGLRDRTLARAENCGTPFADELGEVSTTKIRNAAEGKFEASVGDEGFVARRGDILA